MCLAPFPFLCFCLYWYLHKKETQKAPPRIRERAYGSNVEETTASAIPKSFLCSALPYPLPGKAFARTPPLFRICGSYRPYRQKGVHIRSQHDKHSDFHGNGCCRGVSPPFPYPRTARPPDFRRGFALHGCTAYSFVRLIIAQTPPPVKGRFGGAVKEARQCRRSDARFFPSRGRGR